MYTIDAHTIEEIRKQTKQNWKDCVYKDFTYFAMQFPRGYVYANKFYFPESYKLLCKLSSNGIVPLKQIPEDILNTLRNNGCYITSGSSVTICGQAGELYDVPVEYFNKHYTSIHISTGIGSNKHGYHDHFREPPVNWTAVTSDENLLGIMHPGYKMVAIFIEPKISGVFKRPSGEMILVNSPALGSENKGSFAIVPAVQGTTGDELVLDYTNMDIMPLQVFITKFNRTNWNKEPYLKNIGTSKQLLITDVRNKYKLEAYMHTYSIVAEVNWVNNAPLEMRKAVVSDKSRQFFVKFAVRLPREREPELMNLLKNFRQLTRGMVDHSSAIKLVEKKLNAPVTTLHLDDFHSLARVYCAIAGKIWYVSGTDIMQRFMEFDTNQFVNYGAIFTRDANNAWTVIGLTGKAQMLA